MTPEEIRQLRLTAEVARQLLDVAAGQPQATSTAAHLVVAIQTYRKAKWLEGGSVPRSFDILEQVFAVVSAGVVTSPQDWSVVGPTVHTGDADLVPAPSSLLSRPQAAARMRCSVQTLDRRIRAGQLAAVRNGRLVRLRVSDIDTFLEGAPPC